MPVYDFRVALPPANILRERCRPNAVPFPHRPVVTDAAGQVAEYVIWCDTETGELERYDRDDKGFVYRNNGIRTVTELRPAPLDVRTGAESQKAPARQTKMGRARR